MKQSKVNTPSALSVYYHTHTPILTWIILEATHPIAPNVPLCQPSLIIYIFSLGHIPGKEVLKHSNLRPPNAASWCSRWCECSCQCTFHRPSPQSTTHSIGARVLLEPKNKHMEHSKPCKAGWQPKRFHVQKQVVQRKAEKNTPKIKHLVRR